MGKYLCPFGSPLLGRRPIARCCSPGVRRRPSPCVARRRRRLLPQRLSLFCKRTITRGFGFFLGPARGVSTTQLAERTLEEIFARIVSKFHLAAGNAFTWLETIAPGERARFPERDSRLVADELSRFCPANVAMVEMFDDESTNVFALSFSVHRPACLVLLARAHRV